MQKPIFLANTSVDHLVEIIKILGTPTHEEIQRMNPDKYNKYNFP